MIYLQINRGSGKPMESTPHPNAFVLGCLIFFVDIKIVTIFAVHIHYVGTGSK